MHTVHVGGLELHGDVAVEVDVWPRPPGHGVTRRVIRAFLNHPARPRLARLAIHVWRLLHVRLLRVRRDGVVEAAREIGRDVGRRAVLRMAVDARALADVPI